ncbi:MAG: LacI family DNA-binding transcriptional regulator, partial [Candidatus Gallimonas sp.]
MNYTIRDIAEKCGVSISCVSRILSDDKTLRVRPEVRRKVIEEAERTGYTPNYYARQLANGTLKSKKDIRIGYVTYKGEILKMNPYFDRVIEGITASLSSTGYQVFPFYVDEIYSRYQKKLPLCEQKLDGLILFGAIPNDLIGYLTEQAKYLASIYGDKVENADFVGSDLHTTLNGMLDYIKRCGYEEIGLITGEDVERIEAITRYAEKIGVKINPDYLFSAANSMQRAYEIIGEKLKTLPPPKVICCMNDEMAIGTMNALLDAGYRIPEDVSVTGHDDITKSNYSRVPLTTVRIFKEEIGRIVTELLLDRIKYKRKFPIKV